MTTAERSARLAKAQRLADVLEQAGAVAEDVPMLAPEAWGRAAEVAGVRAPSEQTTALVEAILVERARSYTEAEVFGGWAA